MTANKGGPTYESVVRRAALAAKKAVLEYRWMLDEAEVPLDGRARHGEQMAKFVAAKVREALL